ncbi:pollen-specific leucine-rich repeat extensin-like protein 1 [Punica granatum]|uniref:Pollen-specific leucine-rich repeat extensin-like protein 1 n=1 Tax=Punica granatum TaxID=22663 RepID=A0A6P8BZ20_PUNGR|nr:pollen-specific leucine-rich repeat extensin-like protein 1 [Punica granatum]
MAQENQTGVLEEINPPTPAHPQPPVTHAALPLNPTGMPPAYLGAPSTYLPSPTSTGAPLPHSGFPPPPLVYAPPPSTAQVLPPAHNVNRMIALEGNVTTLQVTFDLMAVNMAEMMALIRGPNCSSSSSTPPFTHGLTVDPAPWAPPTLAPESNIASAAAPMVILVPAPYSTHVPAVHPIDFFQPQSTIPAVASLPPMTIPTPDSATLALPPMSVSVPATIYTIPPPMVLPMSSAPAPAQATETFPY